MSFDLKDIPLPTIDRPFGIQLWPYFNKAFELALGYPADDFRFVSGETPMSTLQETAAALVTYYVVIFGGREVMKNFSALKLNTLFMLHNFVLTSVSGILLVLFLEQLIPTIYHHGVFYAICSHEGGWTQPLVVLYYLNYLNKYFEFLDTLFLVLKKKPLTFLHTYHHGATALLCYTQLLGLTSVSWVPITLNLLVHVVMYWYYFQSARGIRIWWKKYITILQIAQFVIDLVFVYFASYTYFSNTYFQWAPNYGTCAGEEFAAFSGMGILTSYLVLFISFYFVTYKKTAKTGRPRRNTGRQALIDMKDAQLPSVPVAGHANGNGAASRNGKGPVTRSRKA
ncbi:uncharacterized protein TRUGW13939_10810 [Talaromyces rugulosus]|uniref:Elongation of fatty acids protein n=1 Tax=Talaromyces rugulosus TaxID=121627 RepID=A0A7H8RB04_TALRU|nr:uncharacterized protein TRUGW13939_10810 [Talaromyces rugulosus]QKX63639.1 hypothetical protein TRUGW13939_10810 [Talaromyces rugulosus]